MHVPPALAPALALAAALAAAPAAAETALHAAGPLYEAACDVDVQLRGAQATVEVRQRLVNPGPGALAARYDVDLPPGAVVTGLALRSGGGTTEAVPVRAHHATVAVAVGGVVGADPAVLIARPPGAASTHTLHLQPIAPDDEVVVTTRYTTLAEIRAGARRLVLPGRGAGGKLTACRGTARAATGPGARVTRLVVDDPLTLRLSDSRPIAVLGDADSTAPIDIDAIEGGVPAVRRPIRVDATTPLGGLRPSRP